MASQLKNASNCDELVCESSIDRSKQSIDSKKSFKSMARLRWNILSTALHERQSTYQTQLGSMRQFSTFGLIHIKHKYQTNNNNNNNHNNNYNDISSQVSSTNSMSSSISQTIIDESIDNFCREKWFEIRFKNDDNEDNDEKTVIEIRFSSEKIPIHELVNTLDNTGNVCLWPSEEVLAYYCYKRRDFCSDKIVLELGGGMTCLAGLVSAVFTSAKEVILTDGNERCVENMKAIVERNGNRFNKSIVKCKQLRWGDDYDINEFINKVDVILCSDCLYFDGSRHLLVDTIFKLLQNSGIAIILAPTRGTSLHHFVDIAKQKFETKQITIYDNKVWRRHQHFANNSTQSHYITDLHYPIMITLRKSTSNH